MNDAHPPVPEPKGSAASCPSPSADRPAPPPWPVLVADDDPLVHKITALVLSGARFLGRGLEFLHARSGEEVCRVMESRPDIALILLDVVMETDRAGLDAVRHIRGTLGNKAVRIILRTGQPGQAPEQDVMVEYDINDYKAKSELTAQKLFTSVMSALRAYEHVQALARGRQGLAKIVEGLRGLVTGQSAAVFASGVIEQMESLLGLRSCLLAARDARSGSAPPARLAILAGTGSHADRVGEDMERFPPPAAAGLVREALSRRRSVHSESVSVCYARSGGGREVVLVLETPAPLRPDDRRLVELFCQNLAIACERQQTPDKA